ncbi:S4 domain-containing protein YaaA [Sporolactobacillus kofuensis]|uniref:S4 domain-containing protein YaaA n=1 Tax=Sporolactobacillus kofuensis TaxID=269672 RepID=A0ABW1WC81_9BACL|nr:S4 domain-containing protein YaaA [Sporolactobacillus kofuensis]MCO7175274.1 S4 domain-containing protein YaaA [Sporolactobacillus kofuensis]
MKQLNLNNGELFITLGQLLKYEGLIQTGGEAKHFLSENEIFVNDEHENRRGKKLYEGDRIKIVDSGEFIISRR